jgi:hypothetical protein
MGFEYARGSNHRFAGDLGRSVALQRYGAIAPTRIKPHSSAWLDPRLTRAVECQPGYGTLANPGRRPDDEIEEGVRRRCEWVGR